MKRLVRVETRVYVPGFDPKDEPAVEGKNYSSRVSWLRVDDAEDPKIAETVSNAARSDAQMILGFPTAARDGGRG